MPFRTVFLRYRRDLPALHLYSGPRCPFIPDLRGNRRDFYPQFRAMWSGGRPLWFYQLSILRLRPRKFQIIYPLQDLWWLSWGTHDLSTYGVVGRRHGRTCNVARGLGFGRLFGATGFDVARWGVVCGGVLLYFIFVLQVVMFVRHGYNILYRFEDIFGLYGIYI